jgi:CubicO group peptidase (beta-lactamase class C family)
MKRRCCAAMLLFVILSSAASIGQAPDAAVQVDRLFAAWDHKDTPGCVVLVRQDGKTIYEHAFGMADLEHGLPLTLGSVFLLASVSKQFVVFCIMLLAQAGRINLDDDVHKYIPELPDFGKKITIDHLIHHTSGLREDLTCFNLAGWRSGDIITRDDFLRFVKNQKDLNFEPGREYLYCNTGYHLLALIVERVSGQPLPQYARENIFGPLGMKATVVRDSHRTLIPNLAVPYGTVYAGKSKSYQLARIAHDPPGASNVHSSVRDLALWDQNFYDTTIGNPKLLGAMQVKAKLNSGKEIKYAGGLQVDTYRGLKTVTHTGSHGGYKTVILRFPDQRFSVIVLANVRDFVPIRMAKKVADIYLADRLEPRKEPEIAKIAGDNFASFTGEYRFGYSIWRVGRDADGLFVNDGGDRKRLFPTSETEFFDREDGTRYRFVAKKDDMFLETRMEKVAGAGRRLKPITPPAEKLAELVGTYRSPELTSFGSIEVRDGKAILMLPKGEATLQFLDNGDCIARYPDAFFTMLSLKFTRNAEGAVNGYTLTTERVRNLRYAKVKIE